LSCAICEDRKEKRFCPAVHGRICPQCCGEQREVTLDCPSDCPYLLQARQQAHEHKHKEDQGNRAASHQPLHADHQAFFSELQIPQVEIPEQFLYEREELILGLSFALAKSARGNRSLMDRDLIAAASALANRYQRMADSGLIFEPESQTANLARQAVIREIENMVREFRQAEQQHIGHTRLRDSEVLKALVFLSHLGLERTSGRPKSREFIDFLFAQFPQKQSALVAPDEVGSRIVIP
jgi:hypothetical protein